MRVGRVELKYLEIGKLGAISTLVASAIYQVFGLQQRITKVYHQRDRRWLNREKTCHYALTALERRRFPMFNKSERPDSTKLQSTPN